MAKTVVGKGIQLKKKPVWLERGDGTKISGREVVGILQGMTVYYPG